MSNVAESAPIFNLQQRKAADIIKNGVVDMPAADAALILRECRFDKQERDLTTAGDLHKKVLADLMRRNQWRPFEKIDFVEFEGRVFVINGYHRLGAQVLCGAKIKWIFVIHKCRTKEQVFSLFHSFDTNQKTRSTEQILNAIDAAEVLGVSKTTVKNVYNAVPLIMAGFDFSRAAADPLIHRLIDLRMEKVRSLQAAAIEWEKATSVAPVLVKRRLGTQGAMAVALVCFQSRPVEAFKFWNGVALNDGLRIGDPRRTYLALLNATGSAGTSFTLATQTAVAWNAWFTGRDLKIIKIVENARFRIAGTAWDR